MPGAAADERGRSAEIRRVKDTGLLAWCTG